jgi:hypothetical protein
LAYRLAAKAHSVAQIPRIAHFWQKLFVSPFSSLFPVQNSLVAAARSALFPVEYNDCPNH